MSPEAAEYGDGLRTGSAWVSLLGFSSLISGLYTRSLSIPCIVLPVRCLLYLDLRLLSNKLRHKLGGVSGSRPWMVRRSHVEGGGSLRFQVLEDGGGFLLPQKSS
ncbi:hypothetical protein Bca52824_073990 [Brassica carinata]|uniref:Uncharacterized protein n=1 Tax=Brassica carinata TaxID=52824 RepID=A0A8X7U797_BRACI|nr:hypothetical protein Bca52824_073990 [Brassica carinata]